MKTKAVSKRISRELSAKEYLRKPYARILTPDAEGRGYTAEILEFPGCVTQGDTPEEAYRNLEEVAQDWIESSLEAGQDIPVPSTNIGYSGHVALRLPRSLHRKAAQMAERDGTSLNQFLVSSIAERVGAESLYTWFLERLPGGLGQTTQNRIFIYWPPLAYEGFISIEENLRLAGNIPTLDSLPLDLQIRPSQLRGATTHA